MPRPIKVTCWLNSPLAGDPPKLDAMLEWAMSLRMRSVLESSNGHRHITGTVKARDEAVIPGAIPIPIAKWKVEGYPWPIPLCSDPILSLAASDGVEYFARRAPVEKASLLSDGERKTVAIDSGTYKSVRLPLRIRSVERIVWFCAGRDGAHTGIAPAKEIRRLLNRNLKAAGKKTADGYGQVSRWDVELIEHDWSWFAPSRTGPVLMRTLPACATLPRNLRGYKKSFGAPVAPYWMPSNFTELVVPC